MTTVEELGMAIGVSHLEAHGLIPPIGDWGQIPVQAGAELGY